MKTIYPIVSQISHLKAVAKSTCIDVERPAKSRLPSILKFGTRHHRFQLNGSRDGEIQVIGLAFISSFFKHDI